MAVRDDLGKQFRLSRRMILCEIGLFGCIESCRATKFVIVMVVEDGGESAVTQGQHATTATKGGWRKTRGERRNEAQE